MVVVYEAGEAHRFYRRVIFDHHAIGYIAAGLGQNSWSGKLANIQIHGGIGEGYGSGVTPRDGIPCGGCLSISGYGIHNRQRIAPVDDLMIFAAVGSPDRDGLG